jgi:WD40 repeat protein
MPSSENSTNLTWQERLLENLRLVYEQAGPDIRPPDEQYIQREIQSMLPYDLPPDAPLPPEVETRLHEYFERLLRSAGISDDVETQIHRLIDSFRSIEQLDIYPSFEQMRSLHLELLRRQREGFTPELVAEISTLVRRGARTGVIIDAESDRDYAQSLLNYWTTSILSQGYAIEHEDLAEFDPDLAPEIPDELCPYRGLNAFNEADSDIFFGRQKQISELVQLVKEHPLIAVVGASGSGKSSLVRAGLVPQLKHNTATGGPSWVFLPTIVPGSHPLENLAALFRPAEIPLKTWTAQASVDLETEPGKIVQMAAQRLGKDVFLVVDQFEETFTLCESPSEQQAFCAALLALARSPEHHHRVLVTMRTDFYEEKLPLVPEFQQATENARLILTPLTPTELRQVIEEPAHKVGLKFEEGVVDRLLQDILGEPAALPLLQFTLHKLWQNRQKNRITLETYKRLGGGRKALERSADEFYRSLLREDQEAVRAILLKLVRPGVGLEVTSRRVRRAELFTKTYASDRIQRVLDRLIQEKLLRLTPGATPEDDQVEVAHEALVRNWSTLINWLDDERVTLRQRQRLTIAAEHWSEMGETPDLLLRGVELEAAMRYDDMNALETRFLEASQALRSAEEQKTKQEAQRLRKRNQVITVLAVLAFIVAIIAVYQSWQASLQADIAQNASTQAAYAQATAGVVQQNNVLLAQAAQVNAEYAQATAEANANSLAIQEAEARQARQEAEQEARKNKQASIIFQAVSSINSDYSRALLLSVEALQMEDNFESRSNMLSTLNVNSSLEKYLHQSTISISQLLISPDGELLVGRDNDGVIRVWDFSAPSEPELLTSFSVLNGSYQMAFQPGTRNLVIANPSEALLFDLTNPGNPQITSAGSLNGASGIYNLSFSSDGQLLAIVTDYTLTVYDFGALQQLGEPFVVPNPNGDYISGAIFKPGSDHILAVAYSVFIETESRSVGKISLWDVTNLRAPLLIATPLIESPDFTNYRDIVRAMAFSPTGSFLATGSCARWDEQDNCLEGELRFYASTELEKFSLVSLNNAHTSNITSLSFDASGTKLVSTSLDRSAIVWSAVDAYYVYNLNTLSKGHTQEVNSAVFSKNGLLVATAGNDGQVILWNAGPPQTNKFSFVNSSVNSWVWNAVYHPTKPILATKNNSGPLQLWDIQDNHHPYKLFESLDPVAVSAWQTAFHPQGNILAAVGDNGLSLWDVSQPEDTIRLPDPPGSQVKGTTIHFSPNGSLLAVTDRDGHLVLWDFSQPGTPSFIASVPFSDFPIAAYGSAFLSQGSILVIGDEFGEITFWDLSNPAQPTELSRVQANQAALAINESQIYALSVNQAGTLMAISGCFATASGGACSQGFFRLWDITNPTQPFPLSQPIQVHGQNAYANALRPDGALLATSGIDGIVHLWDLENRANPRQLLDTGLVHTPWINDLTFSPEGDQVIASSDDSSFSIWDVSQPDTPTRLSQTFTALASDMSNFSASADRSLVAASVVRPDFFGAPQEDFIAIWQVNNDRPSELAVQFPVGGTGDITSLAMRPDGQVLASGTSSGNLRIWDNSAANIPVLLSEPRVTGASFSSLAFSPDGLWLVTADQNRRISVWDMRNQSRPVQVEQTTSSKVLANGTLTFNPKGNLLAAGGCGLGDITCAQGSIFLWRFDPQANPRLTALPEYWAHNGAVSWLTFHPELPVLATIGDDTQAIFWDISNPNQLDQLSRVPSLPDTGFFSLSFSPDGHFMLSYSSNGAFNLWDAQDLENLKLFKEPLTFAYSYNTYRPSGNIYLAEFSSDQSLSPAAIMLDDRSLTVVALQPETWISRACQIANRNLTNTEWTQLYPDELYRATCSGIPYHISVAQVYIDNGDLQAQAGELDQAAALYRVALEIDPTLMDDPEKRAREVQVEYTLNEGYRLAYAYQLDLALEFFKLAKVLDPTLDLDPEEKIKEINAEIIINQAYDLANQFDYTGAREKFNEALALNPLLDPATEQTVAENIVYNLENLIYSMQDDPSIPVTGTVELMFEFEQSWGYALTTFDWYMLCWNGSLNGQAADALIACEEAVKRSADPALAYGGRGLAYAINGDTQLALEDFSAFLEVHQENPNIAYQVSIIQELVDALLAGKLDSIPELAEALRYNYYFIPDKSSLIIEPIIQPIPTTP